MKLSDFDYYLPLDRIAQHPADKRDHSRLMCLNRKNSDIKHRMFYEIDEFINPGDLLVLNNSKVIPARVLGIKDPTGAAAEILLLRDLGEDKWECTVRPGRRLGVGTKIRLKNDTTALIESVLPGGNRVVRFVYDKEIDFYTLLNEIGNTPLPHYIHETTAKSEDYQTVYAKIPGSSAAPTAGFHFTKELILKLKEKGVLFTEITLHIGLGTFRPVKTELIENHQMHREYYTVSETSSNIINRTITEGNRVISVGTTSCRTLESVYRDNGSIVPCTGSTDIFIYPGYNFKVVDAMITNFHLPKSTLMMLVSAFSGHEFIMNAYKEAVDTGYRFFSFGDAMFIY
ncbi:MAG: tRNA preQ1(34) S-adenosylmethionine ribosyltransferase-isomerase QueA [Ruminococcaceae bacterium]|nr:tRNA preQ1(34) S-adenosylmethionine ribosyltransferase-isomerase QueA [Oscillospiraceae bacterium]